MPSTPCRDPSTPEPQDAAAREAALVRLKPWLERLAQHKVHNVQMAQDAVSATLLAALEAPVEIGSGERLKAWLAGVLRHKVVDQLRSFGPRATVVADEELLEQQASLPCPGGDPAAAMERLEFMHALEHALGQLGPRQAQVFLMREVMEASTESVCAEMAITPGHLWVISHRARQRLQGLLQPWRPG